MKCGLQILLVIAATLPWCASNSAEPLGRLFFTPAQRNTLDAGKQLAKPRQAAPDGPRAAMLNGVVTRSDGESTVWVNGRALDKRPASGVSATASGSDPAAARVKLGDASNTVKMRVGQRLQRSTGKIAESYESNVGRTTGPTPVGKERVVTTDKKLAPSDPQSPPEQALED